MRGLLILSILAVLCASPDAAVVKAPITRANLSVGNIVAGDRVLYSQYLYQLAIPNAVQTQDLAYRGNITNRVTAVRATEQGYTQYASAWIIAGGLGYSNVTVRVQSYRGYGFYYRIDIWGR